MPSINFRKVFNEIKEQYGEYLKSPKIFGSITQNEPSIIIKKDGDKWVEKIYNLAVGCVYISVKMYNIIYTFEMYNDKHINDFHLNIYEDDNFKNSKISVGSHVAYRKRFDEYGEYDHRYLKIRYISDQCSIDIDDTSINEEKLINFLDSIGNGNFYTLYNKIFID